MTTTQTNPKADNMKTVTIISAVLYTVTSSLGNPETLEIKEMIDAKIQNHIKTHAPLYEDLNTAKMTVICDSWALAAWKVVQKTAPQYITVEVI